LRVVRKLHVSEVGDQAAVMDADPGPVAVVPQQFAVTIRVRFLGKVIDRDDELALVRSAFRSVGASLFQDERFAFLGDGIRVLRLCRTDDITDE